MASSTVDLHTLSNAVSAEASAERKLLSAIVERAVRDFLGSNESEAEGAKEWFFDRGMERGQDRRFSFAWVCEQLSLDQSSVLGEISRMQGDELQKARFPKRVFSVRSINATRRNF